MKIALYIPDPAWGHASDDEYETESARHRKSLEKLLNVRLKQKNIGPGADLFSFETWIAISPWWYWTAGPLALFLLGKKINDAVEGWSKLFEKIKPFLSYRPYLNRDAAGVLAISKLSDQLGRFPDSIQLLGYSTSVPVKDNLSDDISDFDFSVVRKIDGAPDPLYLMQTVHAYKCEADGKVYGILVFRDEVAIRPLF